MTQPIQTSQVRRLRPLPTKTNPAETFCVTVCTTHLHFQLHIATENKQIKMNNRTFVTFHNGVTARGFMIGDQIYIPQQIGFVPIGEQWLSADEIGLINQIISCLY